MININSSTSFAFSGYRIPLSECKYVQRVNILHNHRFEQDGHLTLKREMCLSFVFGEYLRSFKEQESKQQLVLFSVKGQKVNDDLTCSLSGSIFT